MPQDSARAMARRSLSRMASSRGQCASIRNRAFTQLGTGSSPSLSSASCPPPHSSVQSYHSHLLPPHPSPPISHHSLMSCPFLISSVALVPSNEPSDPRLPVVLQTNRTEGCGGNRQRAASLCHVVHVAHRSRGPQPLYPSNQSPLFGSRGIASRAFLKRLYPAELVTDTSLGCKDDGNRKNDKKKQNHRLRNRAVTFPTYAL